MKTILYKIYTLSHNHLIVTDGMPEAEVGGPELGTKNKKES